MFQNLTIAFAFWPLNRTDDFSRAHSWYWYCLFACFKYVLPFFLGGIVYQFAKEKETKQGIFPETRIVEEE